MSPVCTPVDMQEFARTTATFLMTAHEVTQHINMQLLPIAQAMAPILGKIQEARTLTVTDVLRLR